jgi:dephospho-CoA kinase
MGQKKLIIGLVGEKGSGKQTFADFLKELANQKIAHVRTSDILAETLNLWTIPTTRINLQHLAIIMDREYGQGSVTRAVEQRIKNLDAEIIILDGVRWTTDVALIRKFSKNVLVYITANQKTRYLRLKKRSSKVNEKGLSFKQFLKEEKEKTEVEIPKIAKTADVKIINDSSYNSFKKQVEQFYKELIPNSH